MDKLTALIAYADRVQRRHPFLAFPYAVIKKYGDDNGSYQAALVTYYGFLSLFPLVLVLVTLLQLVFHNNTSLKMQVTEKVSSYFPLLGDQLQTNIHSIGKTGLGLALGIALTLYGARGAADALRYCGDTIWHVPKSSRPGFPKSALLSLRLMGLGALGFAVSVAVSSLASGLGHGWLMRVILGVVGWAIATLVLTFIFRYSTVRPLPLRAVSRGAAIAGLIIQLLLVFGGIVVAKELKNLDSLYGTFAVVLGLLFWIYLIAQVVIYCAEINTVRWLKLWPRALQADNPTEADRHAYDKYAKTEKRIPPEKVKTAFPRK